jgi:hypothetical protein
MHIFTRVENVNILCILLNTLFVLTRYITRAVHKIKLGQSVYVMKIFLVFSLLHFEEITEILLHFFHSILLSRTALNATVRSVFVMKQVYLKYP